MTAPGWACAAALVGLAGMTPVRLARVLGDRDPAVVWEELTGATCPAPAAPFAPAARATDPVAVGERYAEAGVTVLHRAHPDYPAVLADDPGAPAVLFAHGDPSVLADRRRVAVVGTRSCTPYGSEVAAGLGRDLAEAGVVVVSGLARGIDGAAHVGAVRAGAGPPVAVVGTGLDVPYPASNAGLWAEVRERGAVLGEAPLGTRPARRVFPIRNRIIAALAEVVVVVECHHDGGSLTTVEAAARRGILVGAVPGSVKSPSSRGTNALLADGCLPVRDADDVLTALALVRADRPAPQPLARAATVVAGRSRRRRGPGARRAPPPTGRPLPADGPERAVYQAVGEQATTFEAVLLRTGLAIAEAAEACDRLVAGGWLEAGAGWWSRVPGR